MYLWVLAECYLLQIKSKKSKYSDTAFVLLSVPTFLSLVHSGKLCRILIANIPILDPYNFGHWNCRLSLLSPKRCCCWVYIHHHIPVHSNNIVKEKGILIPREYIIQCPRLSELSPPPPPLPPLDQSRADFSSPLKLLKRTENMILNFLLML